MRVSGILLEHFGTDNDGRLRFSSKWPVGFCGLYTVPQMLTNFQNFFTGRLTGKFATDSYLNIPPHLKRVATLPCEISVFKKSQCSRSN